MTAEPDDEIRDPALRRAIAELRRPVSLDAEVERRALSRIRGGSPVRRLVWLGGALAAGIALLLLARSPEQHGAGGGAGIARGRGRRLQRLGSRRDAAPAHR